jgi:hypothetical protein
MNQRGSRIVIIGFGLVVLFAASVSVGAVLTENRLRGELVLKRGDEAFAATRGEVRARPFGMTAKIKTDTGLVVDCEGSFGSMRCADGWVLERRR